MHNYQQLQNLPKTFAQICCYNPGCLNSLFDLQKFPMISMAIFLKNNIKIQQYMQLISLLKVKRQQYLSSFKQYNSINISCIEIVINQFLDVHVKLKNKNNEISTSLNHLPTQSLKQLQEYNAQFQLNGSRYYYQKLQKIKGIWKQYFYHYLNSNRLYIKSSANLQFLLYQYWLKHLQAQNFVTNFDKSVYLKTLKLDINAQLENIRNYLNFKCRSQIKTITLDQIIKAKQIFQNKFKLFKESKIKTHSNFCDLIDILKKNFNDVSQHTKQYIEQYFIQCQHLIKQFNTRFPNLNNQYQFVNDQVSKLQLTNNIQKQVSQLINYYLNPSFKKIIAIFQSLSSLQTQLSMKMKYIQQCYKDFNELFEQSQQNKFYINQRQKCIIQKIIFNVKLGQCKFIQNEYMDISSIELKEISKLFQEGFAKYAVLFQQPKGINEQNVMIQKNEGKEGNEKQPKKTSQ